MKTIHASFRSVRSAVALLALTLALVVLTGPARASTTQASTPDASGTPNIEYLVDLTNAHTQTIDITMILRGGPSLWAEQSPNALDVAMPIWRPGKYVVMDLAGGIQSIHAKAHAPGAGNRDHFVRDLPMRKLDRATWRIDTTGIADTAEVHVTYRLYCNSLADRTRHVDATHAFLSGSAVFLYNQKTRHMPLRVTLTMPDDWKIATGLKPAPALVNGRRALIAPDYDVLVDSPIEVGQIEILTFESAGKPHEIAIWAQGGGGPSYDPQRLKKDFKLIVDECIAMFGDTPYDRYAFLVHVVPGGGGGTEHLNSTIMQTNPAVFDSARSYRGFLGLTAHEFYHTWNVKQLRPRGLVPYDYQRENYTELLWVAEGTTSYYDDLILARTGQMKESDYLGVLAGMAGGYLDNPGRHVQSLEMSSFDSWIKFNKAAPDHASTTVNFYSVGALASFVLDTELMRATDNRVDLDDLMRALYERYPLSAGGFTTEHMIAVARELTGHDFAPWFGAHIAGTQEMDVHAALELIGLELVREPSKPDTGAARPIVERTERPYVGIRVRDSGGLAQVTTVLTDGPAFNAGVIVNDEIVAVNGVRVRASDFDARIARLDPGAEVRLTLLRRDELMEITFNATPRPEGSWKITKRKEQSDAQKALFESWIGPRQEMETPPEPDSDEAKDSE